MQSIPLRKVRSAFHDRYLLEMDRDHFSELGDRRPRQFEDVSRVNLESLPRTIRECLEELVYLDGQNPPDVSSEGPYCRPKHGKDLLKVIQEARQHQELKIYSTTPDLQDPRTREPRRCKPIRKQSRKVSKKASSSIDFEKSSPETFELPCSVRMDSGVPEIRQIVEIEDTQPSSVQSLWQQECNHPDYLGIEKLLF